MFVNRSFAIALILGFFLLFNSLMVSAIDSNNITQVGTVINLPAEPFEHIQDSYVFYGLASYYNNVAYYIVNPDELIRVSEDDVIELSKNQWLAVVGRFQVLLIQATGPTLQLDLSKLTANNSVVLRQANAIVKIVAKPELPFVAPELNQLRYAHLWGPLAWLSRMVEHSLVVIQSNLSSNWGYTIIIFSVILKFLLLPVSVMTVHFQRRVSQVNAQLLPKLKEIKSSYKGEEAHNRLMAAHKELGITPFYSLKPMLGSFIYIPILIAVFNALGEMPQFIDQSFLWIENLAYPDVIGRLPVAIPVFGDTISLLPFIMTAISLYSTLIFQNSYASLVEIKHQKRNLYLMVAAFFVLFYPFPAVMVLYWTLANILQTIQQQFLKI